MNSRRPQNAAALVLSLVLTLTIFSGVSLLASPQHGGLMLVHVDGARHG